jgi:hypothetical protein
MFRARERKEGMRNLACLLVPFAIVGCVSEDDVGSVAFNITAPAEVTSVRVIASSSVLNAPRIEELSRSGASWTGRLPSLPAGSYTFHSEARDSAGKLVYWGEAAAVVGLGADALVAIILQPTDPGESENNQPPYVQSITVSDLTVEPGQEIWFDAAVQDENRPAVELSWDVPDGGSLVVVGGRAVWTAPENLADVFTVTLTATDDSGEMATAAIVMRKAGPKQTGGAVVSVTFNQWPTITSLVSDRSTYELDAVAVVSARAVDPDGDAISYEWVTDFCATIVEGQGTPTIKVRFLDYDLSSWGWTCEAGLYVRDGRGGAHYTKHVFARPVQIIGPPTITSGPPDFMEMGQGGVFFDHVIESAAGMPTLSWTSTSGWIHPAWNQVWGLTTFHFGSSWTLPACLPDGLAQATLTVTSPAGPQTTAVYTVSGPTCP